MSGVATAVAGATLVGGYLSSQANKDAANTSANAQLQSANIAADAAKFRPVGVTTRFGSSNFGFDDQGNVSSAGYTLSPELQAIQDRIMTTAGGWNPAQYQEQSQGLFNLGKSYLSTSPEAAAADYYAKQRQLMAPGREQDLANITNQQFQAGRSGFGIGGTRAGYTAGGPGLMQANPQMSAYYNSIAASDANLAAQSDQYARDRMDYGIKLMSSSAPGLFNAGYGPLQTALGLSSTIEGLGQQPFSMSSELGGRSSTAGANAGQFLATAGANAARTQQLANQYSLPGQFLTNYGSSPALNNWFNNMITNQQFGNSGMGTGMSGSYTGNVYDNYGNLVSSGNAAPASATWSRAFGGTGGMGD